MTALRTLAVTVALGAAFTSGAQSRCLWPEWADFKAAYLQADGRVIDRSRLEQPTVSEAQAYTAWLALVADDRDAFERVIRWTRDNLAAGDFSSRLPAWHWGQRAAGDWGVLDGNAATDADLWLAYALVEGARRWSRPSWQLDAAALVRRIVAEEVVYPDGRGPVLLPGPQGFRDEDGTLRVNPSYAPAFVLRRLAALEPTLAVLEAEQDRLLDAIVQHGFVPDWAQYVPGVGYRPTASEDGRGSYGAIRLYLWTALDTAAPGERRALARLRPFVHTLGTAALPEWFDPRSGAFGGKGGRAHRAAWLPFLKRTDPRRYRQQRDALRSRPVIASDGSRYYADVLTLIALGADAGRFAIASDGRLLPGRPPCPH